MSVAAVMQRALLSPSVPVVPGADVAAEYFIAADDTAAGGDWFDAIAVDGELRLVVGDVVGYGVRASAVMSQLRATLRMVLLDGRDIGDALAAVSRFSAHVPGAKTATICAGSVNLGSGAFHYCTAGHPPPLLVPATGQPRFLQPSGAGPIGSDTEFILGFEHLDVGDAVLLYTDGLIARPGRPAAASTAEFAATAAAVAASSQLSTPDAGRPIDRLCSQTRQRMLRPTGYSNDIALLGVQRTGPSPPLQLAVNADNLAVADVRARLRRWLPQVGADSIDTSLIEHAVSEYVQNAAEHAYRGDKHGEIAIEAALHTDGILHVSVVDYGQWKTPDPPTSDGRTRGMSLAGTFIASTRVIGDEHGTTAELAHRLTRPALIETEPQTADFLPPPTPATDFDVYIGKNSQLVVTGDVDTATAPTLAGRITAASHRGTAALTIDLNGVTYLGSAGIAVLADAYAQAKIQNTALVFIAAPGTTAHHVLTLVQLPTAPHH